MMTQKERRGGGVKMSLKVMTSYLYVPLFEVERGTYKRSTNLQCTRAGKYRYICLIKFSFIWHGLISLKSIKIVSENSA